MRHTFTCVLFAVASGIVAAAPQPNPPTWPSTVQVFSPGDPGIAAAVEAAFAQNGGHEPANHGQFSSARFAFLFKPSTTPYTVDVPVGFYTHVIGLGASPDDTVFSGDMGVYCEEGDYEATGGALDTFWRAAENFKTTSSHKWNVGSGMMWAVSQAAPLRRVHVEQQLLLFEYQPPDPEAGFASGGFFANSQVDGIVFPGSQQQFMSRNNAIGGYKNGVWNHVLVGTTGAPAAHCSDNGGQPFVVSPTTPTIAEKPFITIDASGKYSVNVPALRTNSAGTDWSTGTSIGFEGVYVANNETDTAATINAQLAAGLHVLLTPGIYALEASIEVNTANQMLLGIGFATLVSANGTPVITVGNVPGVRLVGPILMQAGPKPTPVLLQWGTGPYAGDPTNPGFIYDVFGRVGGPDPFPVQADVMVIINSGNVVYDDTWLWRADHTVSGNVYNSSNPCYHGLLVNGDDVTAYGLAVEHTLRDLVQWSGENGATFLYQSELPYDVTQAEFGTPGYVGYRVNSTVSSHQGWGVGVYHFFRDYNVTVESGIVAPPSAKFVSPLSVFLNGKGVMNHVLNELGNSTQGPNGGDVAYVC